MNSKGFSVENLLHTPVCMMTGEQLAVLLSNMSLVPDSSSETPREEKEKKEYVYGIKGIAQVFGCSIPTANRIKRSGIIDAAITQVGRKIVMDKELALSLAAKAKREKGGRL